jgi:hypothetical protein
MKLAPFALSDGRCLRWAADDATGGSADKDEAQARAAWERLRADETEAQRARPPGTEGIGASPAGGGLPGTTSDAITGLTGDSEGGATSSGAGTTS